jgi:hypothetical protein
VWRGKVENICERTVTYKWMYISVETTKVTGEVSVSKVCFILG